MYAQCVCGSESQIRGFEVALKEFWLNLTSDNQLLSPITSSIIHGFNLRERLLMSNEGPQVTIRPSQEVSSSTKKPKTEASCKDDSIDVEAHKDQDQHRGQAGHAGHGDDEISTDDKTKDQPTQASQKDDKTEKQMEPIQQAHGQDDTSDRESSIHGALAQDQKQHCNNEKQETTLAAEPEVTTTPRPPQGASSNKRNADMLAIEDMKPEASGTPETEITNVQAAAAPAVEDSTKETHAADMEQPSAEKPPVAEMELDQAAQHDVEQQTGETHVEQNEQPSVETPLEQKETIAEPAAPTIEDSAGSQPSHNKDGDLQPAKGTHAEVQNTAVHVEGPTDTTVSCQAAGAADTRNDISDATTPAPSHEETNKHETHPPATAGDENEFKSTSEAAPTASAAPTTEALSEPPEVLPNRPTPEAKATAKQGKKIKNALPGPSMPLDSHPDNVRTYVAKYFHSPAQPAPKAIWF